MVRDNRAFKKSLSIQFGILTGMIISLPASTAHAALGIGVDIPGTKSADITSYVKYIAAVFKFALDAGIALTILMIIYGGVLYMTSQGNQSGLNSAKDIIVGSLSGLAMLLLIILILAILGLPAF